MPMEAGTWMGRALLGAVLCVAAPLPVGAADAVLLTIKDHKFTPDRVTVAAGQRFRIEVTNNDDTVEEFESFDLKFEKIVVPGGTIRVNAGPLQPGEYKFFGDYHPDQATGTVIAVAP
jgi:plastocyanin